MTATATKTKPAAGIRLSRTDLQAALAAVGKAVSGRPQKPILRNVRIGDGLITGTDLEVRIDRAIEEVCEPFLVPHDRLSSIVREARGDEVTLKLKDGSVIVKCGGGSWTLPTEDVAEFPIWEAAGMTPACRLPADQFARAVRATAYACDRDGSRPALGAVLMEIADGIVMLVATDGRRLSAAQCETDQAVDDRAVLIPARAIGIVSDMTHGDGSVQIDASTSDVRFEIDGTTVTARLTEGRFPRWRDVMGKAEGDASIIEIEELKHATLAAAIVTSEQSKGIDLSWQGDTLVLSGRSSEYGESSVKCHVVSVGSRATVKLDPRYIVDFLKGISSKDSEPSVSMFVKDAGSAVLLVCGDYTGVIMPLDASAG